MWAEGCPGNLGYAILSKKRFARGDARPKNFHPTFKRGQRLLFEIDYSAFFGWINIGRNGRQLVVGDGPESSRRRIHAGAVFIVDVIPDGTILSGRYLYHFEDGAVIQ